MNNPEKILCCYCGVREATTKDHIPPKAIFNKPRPSNLITVPCCFNCNNEASKTDERFKAYIGLQVARHGGEAERLFKEGVLPTTKHNNSIRRAVINSFDNTGIYNPLTGKTDRTISWDNDANEAYEKTIERFVRGLFYHHYNEIVPQSLSIETYWFNKEMDDVGIEMDEVIIGEGAFKYRYAKALDAKFSSMWFFNFYDGHFGGGVINEERNAST